MDEGEIIFSFFYFVVVVCFVLPPREFVAAGLTIQNLFSRYLGSEDVDFIGYHMKRTMVTVAVHSYLPAVYYIMLGFMSQDLNLLSPGRQSAMQVLFALLCFGVAIIGTSICFFWSIKSFKHHPISKDLIKYGSPWRGVAAQINLEFRRLEKFSSLTGGTSIYVTDSWIIKSTTYKVYIAQQTDSHLTVVKSEDFHYSPDVNRSAQYLHICVNSIPPHEQKFEIYLNALEYTDLKDRLNAPLRKARNIVINQTLSDRFLDAFKQQVEVNGTIELSSLGNDGVENCIGCMANPANMKLLKRCATLSEGECTQCYCRPMWCLGCMGRWFASRQDKHEPSSWMSSYAPCPTCRAKFCMLDVFKIST